MSIGCMRKQEEHCAAHMLSNGDLGEKKHPTQNRTWTKYIKMALKQERLNTQPSPRTIRKYLYKHILCIMYFCTLQLLLISQRAQSDFVHNFFASQPLKGLIRSDGLQRVWPCRRELLECCALIIGALGNKLCTPVSVSIWRRGGRLLEKSELLKCDETSLYIFDPVRQEHLKL